MIDEILTELHTTKDAIGAAYSGNFRVLFADIKRAEAELAASGIQMIDPPRTKQPPGSALQRARMGQH